jgi:PAS domain S-box-containing protein
MIRDITENKVAVQELKSSEERYRQLFENTPLPMWLIDIEGLRYLDINKAAIEKYGYTREEFLNMTVLEICQAEDIDIIKKNTVTSNSAHNSSGTSRHKCKNGKFIVVEIVFRAVLFENQSACLVTVSDITEKEELRRTLEQSSRLAAIGELAAGVAHEINNPNGMILRNLDFVADVLADALPLLDTDSEDLQLGGLDYPLVCAQVPQLVADMRQGAGHIRDIVRDLKDFSRVEGPVHHEPFELNEAVAAAARLLDGPLRKATDAFELHLAENLPQACGNLRQIEQVVLNLMTNAMQALPDRSRALRVTTCFDSVSQQLVVNVKDQGKGIAPEHLDQLTNPFFTTRRETGGTGLGLSVSSRIVKQHHGRLSFESTLGQGTTARLTLPVAAPLS